MKEEFLMQLKSGIYPTYFREHWLLKMTKEAGKDS